MIPFSKPTVAGKEYQYIEDAIKSGFLSGDGPFTKKCQQWFESYLGCESALLTPSCTSALEMAAILIDIQPGDEVIMPSYTFVSTANAFVLRGAKIVFVDIRPDTMNIDEALIENAITSKTRAIVPVHYAGVACEMDVIMDIAERHGLYVIEDAAQAMMASYKGKALGTIGHIGTYSFHATKNYTSGGEGGLLIVNTPKLSERAEVVREKGTNRSKFISGEIDKYTWVDVGGSHLPSEVQAAYLYSQLESAENLLRYRLSLWDTYYKALTNLETLGYLKLPCSEKSVMHNGHMFFIVLKSSNERERLRKYLVSIDINATSHYVPLHSSHYGKKVGYFSGEDRFTTSYSKSLLRLPIYNSMSVNEVELVLKKIKEFYGQNI